jgi:hydrogenase maturation factor
LLYQSRVLLQVELEALKREMKSKQVLLAQAGKAIELMEEQHTAEMNKLRQEMTELEARVAKMPSALPPHMQQFQRHDRLDNSMQLYLDAFNVRPSMIMPALPFPDDKQCQGDTKHQVRLGTS